MAGKVLRREKLRVNACYRCTIMQTDYYRTQKYIGYTDAAIVCIQEMKTTVAVSETVERERLIIHTQDFDAFVVGRMEDIKSVCSVHTYTAYCP